MCQRVTSKATNSKIYSAALPHASQVWRAHHRFCSLWIDCFVNVTKESMYKSMMPSVLSSSSLVACLKGRRVTQ